LSVAWLLFFPVCGEEHVHCRICYAVELAGGRERVRPGEHDLVHRLVNDETGELVCGQRRGLFPDDAALTRRELVEAQPTSSGAVIATCRPIR